MRDYRRKSSRKVGGMITSITSLGKMVPRAATAVFPRSFSAMTSVANGTGRSFATKGLKYTNVAKNVVNEINKTRSMLKPLTQPQPLPFSQAKLVVELFKLIEKDGYDSAKGALLTNSKYINLLNFLRTKRIPLEIKTVRRMKETLEPEQLTDFLKTFIHFDIEFLRGVKDLRWRQLKGAGISRKELGKIFLTGEREFWEKTSKELEKLVQERDGIIYNSDIHELEHCVEIQTIMTTIIELNLLELVGLEGLTEEKIRSYYNNDFMVKNKYLIDDLASFMRHEDNIFVTEKDLNALKEQVTSHINCGIKIKPIIAPPELTDTYRKYILESVIPSHQKFINMIQTNHRGNFLGACFVEKFTKSIQGYNASIGNDVHTGGFKYIEDIQPILDELIKYELIEQICEDFTSEDSDNTNITKGTSFEDYIVANVLTFLESRDLVFSTIHNLEGRPGRKHELMGGRKTRKINKRR